MALPVSMENTQALSSESFSKWVINLKQSFDGLGDSFRASSDERAFIEMDPTMAPSWRTDDFNFATWQSPSLLVDADELFSSGLLVGQSDCARKLPASSETSRPSFLKRCWKLWSKHLGFHRRASQDPRRRVETKWKETCQITTSRNYIVGDKSIQEAVQHCKRSFEKRELLLE